MPNGWPKLRRALPLCEQPPTVKDSLSHVSTRLLWQAVGTLGSLPSTRDDPRTPKHWRELSDHLAYNILYPEAPEEFLENSKADLHWQWTKEPQIREAVRPQIAELARVATFLASEGLALNAEAYALFVDAVGDNLSVLERRANGDYSRDDTPDSFPPFTDGPTRGSGVSCWELFEAFVKARKPAEKLCSAGGLCSSKCSESLRRWALKGSRALARTICGSQAHYLKTPPGRRGEARQGRSTSRRAPTGARGCAPARFETGVG